MRRHWKLKGMLQGMLSRAPGGLALNDFLQKSSGDLKNFERHLGRKVQDFRYFADSALSHFPSLEGLELVEVGTGWFPLLPVLFSLSGARTVHTYDKTRHLSEELTRRGLRALGDHLGTVSEWVRVPKDELEGRLKRIREAKTIDELLNQARIRYHAPGDASETGLLSQSVDAVFSNSVLEHVPGEIIFRIFGETARILRPGGISVHGVNCGDHYAYFDGRITQINYLQYSDKEWSKWNNALLYQNRLRPRDFQELLKRAGLRLVSARQSARPGCAEAFEKMRLADQFRSYSREDLVCTSFDFVAVLNAPERPA